MEGPDGFRLVSPGLDDTDLRLVEIWRSGRARTQQGDNPDTKQGRFSLLSLGYARLAEKLILRFYEAQQVSATDVSLTQLDDGATLWRSCDVLTSHHVDVKNATSRGSRCRHVFVSKFKKVRSQDVLIAGVISSPVSEFVEHRRRRKKYSGGYVVNYVHQTFLGLASEAKLNLVQQTINALPHRTQALRLGEVQATMKQQLPLGRTCARSGPRGSR